MIKKLTLKSIDKVLLNSIRNNSQDSDSYYVINLIKLKEEVDNFISNFTNKNDTFSYSYKTNYSKPIIKYLDKRGFFSELVSPFEVDISKQYNISPSRIIYNGPLKNSESIEYVLYGGGIVNIDNIEDLKLIKDILSKKNDDFLIRVGLRLSFKEDNLHSRFGLTYDSKEYNFIVKEIINDNKIIFESIHIHYPQRDIESFGRRIEEIMKAAKQIKTFNNNLLSIDIGGGFPSKMPKCVSNSIGLEKVFNLEEFSAKLNSLRTKYSLQNMKFIYEPGTAIAANSMSLVGNIKSINSKGKDIYLNTDLSKALLGNIKSEVLYPISIIKKRIKQNDKRHKYIISGFTCIEGDILGYIESNTSLEIGDLIHIDSIGSYSNVFKSPFIRGDISIFVWDGVSLEICKRAQTAKDICDLYLF